MYIEGLDEVDNQILTILSENARMSFSEIGGQVGLSRVAVKSRMKALEDKGIDLPAVQVDLVHARLMNGGVLCQVHLPARVP